MQLIFIVSQFTNHSYKPCKNDENVNFCWLALFEASISQWLNDSFPDKSGWWFFEKTLNHRSHQTSIYQMKNSIHAQKTFTTLTAISAWWWKTGKTLNAGLLSLGLTALGDSLECCFHSLLHRLGVRTRSQPAQGPGRVPLGHHCLRHDTSTRHCKIRSNNHRAGVTGSEKPVRVGGGAGEQKTLGRRTGEGVSGLWNQSGATVDDSSRLDDSGILGRFQLLIVCNCLCIWFVFNQNTRYFFYHFFPPPFLRDQTQKNHRISWSHNIGDNLDHRSEA